jgi:hypothetical protein
MADFTAVIASDITRHCERSEAIQKIASLNFALDCFAALAMTGNIARNDG